MEPLKAAGRKAEDGLKEAGDAVKGVFTNLVPWLGSDSSTSATFQRALPRDEKQPDRGQDQRRGQSKTSASAPSSLPPRWPGPDGDTAMRHHCVALERLVLMGYSPQAARVAMRHLDAWMVGAGLSDMGAAEDVAIAMGEPILRIGQQVVLTGLVKNAASNGRLGTLFAYRAEDQRWKVHTGDRIYWLLAKFLQPTAPVKALNVQSDSADGLELQPAATELAAGWAKLESRQVAEREKLESREISLLEREAALLCEEDSLEKKRQALEERRRELAVEQAQRIAAIEARTSGVQAPVTDTTDTGQIPFHPVGRSFSMCGNDAGEDEEAEADVEDWDTDWAALSSLNPPRSVGKEALVEEEEEPADSIEPSQVKQAAPQTDLIVQGRIDAGSPVAVEA